MSMKQIMKDGFQFKTVCASDFEANIVWIIEAVKVISVY